MSAVDDTPDDVPARSTRSARRSLLTSLATIVVGAVAVFIAASRDWRPVGISLADFGDGQTRGRPFTALALAALAATAALFAARGWARKGLAVVVVALGTALVVIPTSIEPRANAWRFVVAFGGALIGDGGVRAIRHGSTWPSMSNRYEREARAAAPPTNPWDVIDRGGDPTA